MAAHPLSTSFADLPDEEKARRIRLISDPVKRRAAASFWGISLGGGPRDSRTVSDVAAESGHHQAVGPAPKLHEAPRGKYGPVAPGKKTVGGGLSAKDKRAQAHAKFQATLAAGTKGLEAQHVSEIAPSYMLPGHHGNRADRWAAGAAGLGMDAVKGVEMLGSAVASDAIHNRGNIGYLYNQPLSIGWLLSHGAGIGPKTESHKTKGGTHTGNLLNQMVRGIPGQAMELGNVRLWWDNPAAQIANAAGFVLPILRVGGVARLAMSIKAANAGMEIGEATRIAQRLARSVSQPMETSVANVMAKNPGMTPFEATIAATKQVQSRAKFIGGRDQEALVQEIMRRSHVTRSQAIRMAITESYHPYTLGAYGVEGGFKTRVVKGSVSPKDEAGGVIEAPGRMRGRHPVGRAMQNVGDALSNRIDARNPGTRYSSSRRAAALARRRAAADVAAERAASKRYYDLVERSQLPSKRQRALAALGIGVKPNLVEGHALTSSLQGPSHLDPQMARELEALAHEDVLREDDILRGHQDDIDAMTQEANDLRKERAARREEAAANGEEADTSDIDSKIREIAIERRNKQAHLNTLLGEAVPDIIRGNKIRSQIYTTAKKSNGGDEEKAMHIVGMFDRLAFANSPENPGKWYVDHIESVTSKKLAKWEREGGYVHFQGGADSEIDQIATELKAKDEQKLVEMKQQLQTAQDLADRDIWHAPGALSAGERDRLSKRINALEEMYARKDYYKTRAHAELRGPYVPHVNWTAYQRVRQLAEHGEDMTIDNLARRIGDILDAEDVAAGIRLSPEQIRDLNQQVEDLSAQIRRFEHDDPGADPLKKRRAELSAKIREDWNRRDSYETAANRFWGETAKGAPLQRMSHMGFHYPTRDALRDLGDKPMQASQLYAALREGGASDLELKNFGLKKLTEGDKTRMVVPSEFDKELEDSGYYDLFDAEIKHFSDKPNEGARWDARTLVARHLPGHLTPPREGKGEYRETIVRLPDVYTIRHGSRSRSHFPNDSGVIYHFRYHVYDDPDDNLRTMLLEELQSDAASDFRKGEKRLADWQSNIQRDIAQYEADRQKLIEEEIPNYEETLRVRREEHAKLKAIRVADRTPEQVEANAVARDAVKLAEHRLERSRQLLDSFDHSIDDAQIRLRDLKNEDQPSPMEDRYLRNAARLMMRIIADNDVKKIVIVDTDIQAMRNAVITLDQTPGISKEYSYGTNTEHYIHEDTGIPLTNEEITEILHYPGKFSAAKHGYPREIQTLLPHDLVAAVAGPKSRFLQKWDPDIEGGVPSTGLEGDNTSFGEAMGTYTQYAGDIPDMFKEIYGTKFEHMPNAYIGRYSGQMSPTVPTQSYMPGRVAHISDDASAKARQEEPMYQRNPDSVPKGATEWLADGRARITMFEKADVSTWVHEFAHVAVHDLPEEDLAILSKHLAEGRHFSEWKRADHERFAEQFETYIRTGRSHPALQEVFSKIALWMKQQWDKTMGEAETVNPEVADVFDRMLGKRVQNSVLLSKDERGQVMDEINNLRTALDDPETTSQAADALAELAAQAEEAGIEILRRSTKPEDFPAVLEGLKRRKNAIVEDYRRRGLIGPGEEARGYFPHMSMWEALGAPNVEASRIPAVGQTIGSVRVTKKAVNRNRNRLVRYQTGEVLNDPAAIVYTLRARLRLLETFRARDQLYAYGIPIEEAMKSPNWDPQKFMFIRDPDITPQSIHEATKAMAMLDRKDLTRIQRRREAEIDLPDELDGSKAASKDMMWSRQSSDPQPPWTKTERNVRVVPIEVATKRVGNVFTSAPRGGPLMTPFAVANSLARAASIYLPLAGARYVARNWIQNAVLAALTQPGVIGDVISGDGARLARRDPHLDNMIQHEFGTIQAQALPSFNVRPQTKAQVFERTVTRMSGKGGEHLGKWADVPWRRASWRRHAAKYGHHTDEDYYNLLENPELRDIREMVAQRTREDMIDFDALTPWEKEVLTRYAFIYPFVRGATKWPFMYAREYPGRIAAASYLGDTIHSEDRSGTPLGDLLKFKALGHNWDAAWLNPAGQVMNEFQAAEEMAVRNAKGKYTVAPIVNAFAAPAWEYGLDAATSDLGSGALNKLGGTFVPFFNDARSAKGGLKSYVDYALKTFGNQTTPDSIKRSTNKWTKEIDNAVKWADAHGHPLHAGVKAKLERAKLAYADWNEEVTRAEWAQKLRGEDSVAKRSRAALLLEVAHEHYLKEIYERADREVKAKGYKDIETWIATGPEDNVEHFYNKARDMMFGLHAALLSELKKKGYNP